MICQAKSGDASCEQAWAVLMARIVDRTGMEIRMTDVSSIHYSLCEVDPYWPEHLIVVRGCRNVPLCVADVLFDALKTQAPWNVDDVGYNFQHKFTFERNSVCREARVQYALHYEFEMASGERTLVRFQLKCASARDLLGRGYSCAIQSKDQASSIRRPR